MFFVCHYSGILNTTTQVMASSLEVFGFILSLRQKKKKKKELWGAMLKARKMC